MGDSDKMSLFQPDTYPVKYRFTKTTRNTTPIIRSKRPFILTYQIRTISWQGLYGLLS